jgi:hypothetical protein
MIRVFPVGTEIPEEKIYLELSWQGYRIMMPEFMLN